MESGFGGLSKEVAALTLKIAAQSATIEAQNKKIETQQRAIDNFSTIISDQKRVMERLIFKVEQLIGSPKTTSKISQNGTGASMTAAVASETAADAELDLLSQNVTVRSHRRRCSDKSKQSTIDVTSENMLKSDVSKRDNETINDQSSGEPTDKWTIVDYHKKKTKLNLVQKGGNDKISAFQGVEKKLFLHVWSLHPDTTEESIKEHVIKTCGSLDVKIEKIIPKTVRDYASFKIGVPESCFVKINNNDCWPLNAKFNEWVWFRVPRKTAKSGRN